MFTSPLAPSAPMLAATRNGGTRRYADRGHRSRAVTTRWTIQRRALRAAEVAEYRAAVAELLAGPSWADERQARLDAEDDAWMVAYSLADDLAFDYLPDVTFRQRWEDEQDEAAAHEYALATVHVLGDDDEDEDDACYRAVWGDELDAADLGFHLVGA